MASNRLRSMVLSAAMAALALTLPVAFHAAGLGSQFLPLLLPLLLNGFLVSPWWAAGTGFIAPWISALATGMPPLYPPVAAILSIEAAAAAGLASLIYRRGKRRVWPALIVAILTGRAISFFLTWLLAAALDLPPALASIATTAEGLPGVALQLAVIPIALRLISKRRGPLLDDIGCEVSSDGTQ